MSRSYSENQIPAHRSHCDHGPPVGVKHCLECCIFGVLFKHKDKRGKHDGPNEEEEKEQAELLDVGGQGLSKSFQANGVPRQLEHSNHPQGFRDPGHLQQSECLRGSGQVT